MSFLLISCHRTYIQFFGFDRSPTTGGFSLSHNKIMEIVYFK